MSVGDLVRDRRGDERPRAKRAAINALRDVYRAILILEGAVTERPTVIAEDRELLLDVELCRDRLSKLFDEARGV
jgi:hypothetical protein